MSSDRSWPDASEYGQRFARIDSQLARSFESAELRWEDPEVAGRVRYRLAKIAIAGEDIRRAIGILERVDSEDEEKASALVELRNACAEVTESFADIDAELIEFLNRTSE